AMHSMKEADVLLAVGTRLSVFGTLPSYDIDYFPKSAAIIQIDINPRHIARTHPVEVGIIGDAKSATEAIYEQLSQESRSINTERLNAIAEQKEKWEKELHDLAMEEGN